MSLYMTDHTILSSSLLKAKGKTVKLDKKVKKVWKRGQETVTTYFEVGKQEWILQREKMNVFLPNTVPPITYLMCIWAVLFLGYRLYHFQHFPYISQSFKVIRVSFNHT